MNIQGIKRVLRNLNALRDVCEFQKQNKYIKKVIFFYFIRFSQTDQINNQLTMKNQDSFNQNLYKNVKLEQSLILHAKSSASLLANVYQKQQSEIKKKIEKEIVKITNQNYEKQMEIYNWRSKTQFPIAKVYCYKIISNKFSHQKTTVVEVSYQAPVSRLYDLGRLPLFQILYLLKQSLIGFERLFNRFGSFQVSDKMIFLNKSKKCKVWCNQNAALNSLISSNSTVDQKQFGRQSKISEQRLFLLKICQLFQLHTIQSKTSSQFFIQIKATHKMIQAISCLQNFSKNNKIIVSNCLNLNSSISRNSPNKLTLSKYYPSKRDLNDSIIGYKKQPLNTSCSFIKLQQSQLTKAETQVSQIQSKNIPKFLSKKSQQQTDSPVVNPQNLGRSFLNKSKSYHYLKNLKQSTFTKLDKSKHEVNNSVSFDESSSQVTSRSLKTMGYLMPQSNIWSSRTPNEKRQKEKNDFSFKKQSLGDDENKLEELNPFALLQNAGKQCRERKYSNDSPLKRISNDYQFKGIKIYSPVPIKQHAQQDSKNVSLENSIEANKKSPFVNALNTTPAILKERLNMNVKNIKKSSETTQSAENEITNDEKMKNNQQDNLLNIFQKNGWKMQIDTLIGNGISIRQSIKDGKQQRSQFLGSTFDFAKLARFGRTIEGSMTPEDQFRCD